MPSYFSGNTLCLMLLFLYSFILARVLTQSIGLLSYTFLARTGHDRIVVPMVSFLAQASGSVYTFHSCFLICVIEVKQYAKCGLLFYVLVNGWPGHLMCHCNAMFILATT